MSKIVIDLATGSRTVEAYTEQELADIAAYAALQHPTPASVTMRQARLALLGAGLLADVNDAVAAMPGAEGDAARIEWEYALSVERSSPLVAGLSAALSLSEAQLDALFTAAAAL